MEYFDQPDKAIAAVLDDACEYKLTACSMFQLATGYEKANSVLRSMDYWEMFAKCIAGRVDKATVKNFIRDETVGDDRDDQDFRVFLEFMLQSDQLLQTDYSGSFLSLGRDEKIAFFIGAYETALKASEENGDPNSWIKTIRANNYRAHFH